MKRQRQAGCPGLSAWADDTVPAYPHRCPAMCHVALSPETRASGASAMLPWRSRRRAAAPRSCCALAGTTLRAALAAWMVAAAAAGAPPRPGMPPPAPSELLLHAAGPLVAGWFSRAAIETLAEPDVSCDKVLMSLDYVVVRMHEDFDQLRRAAHEWQEAVFSIGYQGQAAGDFFRSEQFMALLYPVISAQRESLHTMEFIGALGLLHNDRCFFPDLRDTLGSATAALKELSSESSRVQFSLVYKGMYSVWDESTDVVRHIDPIWQVIGATAKLANALAEARVVLDRLYHPKENEPVPFRRGDSEWQDGGGAFSDMNFLHRQLFGGWHLDHGVVAWLLRLWHVAPESGAGEEAAEATESGQERPACEGGRGVSVADFGAGGGHYCDFLNRTGDVCCFAYDGSPKATKLTGGAVQTQRLDESFDLGRAFDWVLCLEAAEHIPRESVDAFMGNLRRHARQGVVLSWSRHQDRQHPNARPWPEVRGIMEAAGFVLDERATLGLRPQLAWLHDAVHVFRVA
eukprot:TRINITY_DN26462_c0_g1_i1.p1 TRINITY_DN26462_c0_g1~~TRINITY_DN26462_c0_g1_i1.p1  ORF type:complete len:517 (+),score=94.35 TRINITY_DN26462_c0_g1_i1:154-1704(+)